VVKQEEYSRLREKAIANNNHIMISDDTCRPIFTRPPKSGYHPHGELIFEDPECTIPIMCTKHHENQMFMQYNVKYACSICVECLTIDYKFQRWKYLDSIETHEGTEGK